MSEREITNPLLVQASLLGARLWRQNTGRGWVGRLISNAKGRVALADARPFHAGLCKGSSDVIGITPVTITADMVGQRVGLFTAFEIKTATVRLSPEQRAFLQMVADLGGIAAEVRSVDDGLDQIRRYVPAAP